jgi:hypothetical protein
MAVGYGRPVLGFTSPGSRIRLKAGQPPRVPAKLKLKLKFKFSSCLPVCVSLTAGPPGTSVASTGVICKVAVSLRLDRMSKPRMTMFTGTVVRVVTDKPERPGPR